MLDTKLIKPAIERYTGGEVASLLIHPDPKVDDACAVRVTFRDGDTQDYVVCARPDGGDHDLTTVIDNLEEAQFSAWPPPSGRLRFFT